MTFNCRTTISRIAVYITNRIVVFLLITEMYYGEGIQG